MIKSMTAFASETQTRNGITLSIEIRCYNARHLDMAIRLPAAHARLEDFVRQKVSGLIQRGRVEIRIGIATEAGESASFRVNESLADAYYHVLNRIRDRYGLADPVTLAQIAGTSGIIEPEDVAADMTDIQPVLEETLSVCLENLEKMRETEGYAIAADLAGRTDKIAQHIAQVEEKADGLPVLYKARLENRINELTHGMVEIDPGRIAQEAAFLADKCDISEEITRAKSHLDQFTKLMAGNAPAGKPLNFLLQEFSREFNTMGSKAGNAEISHVIVSAKTELEKIREQVQNIE